jgi:hypothetical protein
MLQPKKKKLQSENQLLLERLSVMSALFSFFFSPLVFTLFFYSFLIIFPRPHYHRVGVSHIAKRGGEERGWSFQSR